MTLRRARAQAAVVRTLAMELERQHGAGEATEGLQAQAVEESARLVAALDGLSRARSTPPPPPPVPVPVPRRQEPPGSGRSAERPWARVLVVEDDDEARAAIARGLAPEYEVVTACDGVEGLKAATETSFDAIVTDMHMPGIDGVTMVDRIRRLRAPSTVPVIFLSAETAPDRIAAGFSAGATSYMIKPVDLALLDGELRRALALPEL